MCPRGVVNGRGMEKACKSVPSYPTGSLVLHKKKETTAQRQSLQTVEKVLCRGAQCAPVLVSCMSSFPGNALPRQASGRTMFAPTVSTMGKMVF